MNNFVLCCLFFVVPSIFAQSDSSIPHISEDDFAKVHGGEWFVVFYAPWCPHCKRLMPVLEDLPQALSHTQVQVAKVDCTENKDLCTEQGITGFPTSYFYANGKQIRYEGPRTLDAFAEFCDGGYNNVKEKSWSDKLFEMMKGMQSDFAHIIRLQKGAMALVLVGGGIFGFLFGFIFGRVSASLDADELAEFMKAKAAEDALRKKKSEEKAD